MKDILLIFIALSFFSISCKTTNNTKSKTDEIIITFAKKSGRGISPAYSLEIFESGKIIFNGEKNIDKSGKHQKQLTSKEIDKIKQEFINIDFFNLENEYTSKITDLPTTYISFTQDGKSKKIRDYHGAPAELKELEKLIEKIVHESGWIDIEK